MPGGGAAKRAIAESGELERQLWRLAGESMNASPTDSAPRLYMETLNDMFDSQSTRVAALNNRIPGAVLALEIVGAALALGLLAFFMGIFARGVLWVGFAGVLVAMLLFVTFDLDRPTRGLIDVPDTALVVTRAGIIPPPAAPAPTG